MANGDNGKPCDVDPLQVRARLTLPQICMIFCAGIGFAGTQYSIYSELRALREMIGSINASSMHHAQWDRWEADFRQANEAKGIRVPYMHQLIRPGAAAPAPGPGHASY